MAVAAVKVSQEFAESLNQPTAQEYAHSLNTLYQLGGLAVGECYVPDDNSPLKEAQAGYEALARDDLTTAITEMLKTDPEFRRYLDVDVTRCFDIIDGQVRNAAGQPIVELIEAGAQLSATKALEQPTMAAQAERDQLDVELAKKVDALPVGSTLHALSMEPKAELAADKDFWEGLGYRDGIAYWQWYSKTSENTLVTGIFSIDLSDQATWSQVFTELGHPVDPNESPNRWLGHAFERVETPEAAAAFISQLRQTYYQKRGQTEPRISVSDYVAANQSLVEAAFNEYYPALAAAVYSGKNNPTLQKFAKELLQQADNLKPELRRQLMRTSNSAYFDEAAGRDFDTIFRYSLVEELRKGIGSLVTGRLNRSGSMAGPAYLIPEAIYSNLLPQMMNRLLASNVGAGTRAGRSYGGCAGQVNLSGNKKIDSIDDLGNPQDAYGRQAEADQDGEESEGGACEYIHDGCYCCAYGQDGQSLPSRIKVRARRDNNGTAHCLRSGCNAWLSADGKHGDIGNIARKAEKLRQQKRQPKPAKLAYNGNEEETKDK